MNNLKIMQYYNNNATKNLKNAIESFYQLKNNQFYPSKEIIDESSSAELK